MKKSASVGVFSLIFWLCLAGVLILLSSCGTCENTIPAKSSPIYAVRAQVLEGNCRFTTYVVLPDYQKDIFRNGDTVWVNMDNHLIDDSCSNAMACKLIK